MTPETKGQPEPRAWVVENGPHDPSIDIGAVEAEAAHWREHGYPDAEAIPTYDVDVPGLLAQREKLVEALEWVEWTRGVGPFCPACCNRKVHGHRHDCSTAAALAAAREES